MSSAPKGFEPMYTKVWPERDVTIKLERIEYGKKFIANQLASYRATVSDAATGERIFAMDRWGARLAIMEAARRAGQMGLKIIGGEKHV